MPYLDRITLLVQEWVNQRLVTGSIAIESVDVLGLVDDGNPEGGVMAITRLHLGADFSDWNEAPNLVEWATRDLDRKLQAWSYTEDRRPVVVTENDTTLLLAFPFIPHLDQDEFVRLARALVPHADEVIDIHFSGGNYLEVTRVLNRNPTTMVTNRGNGECIRHHGESVYITKHLLKLALGI